MDNLDQIKNDDLLVATSNGVTGKVTGQAFKSLLLPDPEAITIPVIRFTGEYNSYGQLKYELVSLSTWNRPNEGRYGYWAYTRDGSYWYDKYDDYGSFWFDGNVLQVRYEDRHKFDGKYIGVYSKFHDIGT